MSSHVAIVTFSGEIKPGIRQVKDITSLSEETIKIIDRLVGTGFGVTRAEVIKNVIEHSLRRNKTIGRCELCGLIDHHLIDGACEKCNEKVITFTPQDGYKVGEVHD